MILLNNPLVNSIEITAQPQIIPLGHEQSPGYLYVYYLLFHQGIYRWTITISFTTMSTINERMEEFLILRFQKTRNLFEEKRNGIKNERMKTHTRHLWDLVNTGHNERISGHTLNTTVRRFTSHTRDHMSHRFNRRQSEREAGTGIQREQDLATDNSFGS